MAGGSKKSRGGRRRGDGRTQLAITTFFKPNNPTHRLAVDSSSTTSTASTSFSKDASIRFPPPAVGPLLAFLGALAHSKHPPPFGLPVPFLDPNPNAVERALPPRLGRPQTRIPRVFGGTPVLQHPSADDWRSLRQKFDNIFSTILASAPLTTNLRSIMGSQSFHDRGQSTRNWLFSVWRDHLNVALVPLLVSAVPPTAYQLWLVGSTPTPGVGVYVKISFSLVPDVDDIIYVGKVTRRSADALAHYGFSGRWDEHIRDFGLFIDGKEKGGGAFHTYMLDIWQKIGNLAHSVPTFAQLLVFDRTPGLPPSDDVLHEQEVATHLTELLLSRMLGALSGVERRHMSLAWAWTPYQPGNSHDQAREGIRASTVPMATMINPTEDMSALFESDPALAANILEARTAAAAAKRAHDRQVQLQYKARIRREANEGDAAAQAMVLHTKAYMKDYSSTAQERAKARTAVLKELAANGDEEAERILEVRRDRKNSSRKIASAERRLAAQEGDEQAQKELEEIAARRAASYQRNKKRKRVN